MRQYTMLSWHATSEGRAPPPPTSSPSPPQYPFPGCAAARTVTLPPPRITHPLRQLELAARRSRITHAWDLAFLPTRSQMRVAGSVCAAIHHVSTSTHRGEGGRGDGGGGRVGSGEQQQTGIQANSVRERNTDILTDNSSPTHSCLVACMYHNIFLFTAGLDKIDR